MTLDWRRISVRKFRRNKRWLAVILLFRMMFEHQVREREREKKNVCFFNRCRCVFVIVVVIDCCWRMWRERERKKREERIFSPIRLDMFSPKTDFLALLILKSSMACNAESTISSSSSSSSFFIVFCCSKDRAIFHSRQCAQVSLDTNGFNAMADVENQ